MKSHGIRLVLYALAATVILFLVVQLWYLGWIVAYRSINPVDSAFMRIRRAELSHAQPPILVQQQWEDYEHISIHLKRALIASEDAKFIDHEGFDWDGIESARKKNEKRGHVVAGGSTITQQLAKNLFLSPAKSYWRKGEEAIITVMLETVLDKERIFEIYLNVIEWGNGIFGCEAAARNYYHTSCAKLNPTQAAKLAAMVPNPRFYHKNFNAPGLRRKTGIILRRMGSAETPEDL